MDLPDGRQDFHVYLVPPLIESRYEAEAAQIHHPYLRTTQTYFSSWVVVVALELGALAFYLSRRRKWPFRPI